MAKAKAERSAQLAPAGPAHGGTTHSPPHEHEHIHGNARPVGDGSLEAFAARCRANGLSVTRQRLAIFAALSASRAHPSAEQLHTLVQKENPSLSLATIYKNLEALRAIGAVSDVNPLHAQGRYEAALPGTGAGESHHHLVCTQCHTVCDLPISVLPRPTLKEEDALGFEIREVRVQVEGLCPSCRTKSAA